MTGVCDTCWRGENMDLWCLFVRSKYGSVSLVCELRMRMRVCLWDENMDVWERTCVTLVCELRMWMCGGLWDENMDVWRLLVSWECGCVSVWDENMDCENVLVWHLYVSWECGFVTLVCGWECGCSCNRLRMTMQFIWVYLEARDISSVPSYQTLLCPILVLKGLAFHL
jgi:hypothetical protein